MKKYFIYFCSALMALHGSAALAFTDNGVEVEPLFFGQVTITDNSSIRSCTIPAGGTMTCNPEITILNPGQYGVFQLSGFDPTVAIWPTIADTTLTGGGFTFNVTNFTFAPAITFGSPEDPQGGTLTLEIGATISTVAGTVYNAATYHGTYDLQINY